MDIKYLRYIVEIARHLNMTKAAEKLYVSQSSLSQYVSKLEAELGAPIFVRNKRDLVLTEVGKLYVEAAQEVIDIQKNLYKKIEKISNQRAITMGITSNWSLQMATNIVSHFKLLYPTVHLEIIEDNVKTVINMIKNKELDLALISTNNFDGLESQSQLLFNEEVLLGVHKIHPCFKNDLLSESSCINQEDLATFFGKERFILSKQGTPIRSISDQILALNKIEPSTTFEMNGMHEVRNLVSKGVGVAFLPSSCALESENVRYLKFQPRVTRQNILATRKNLIIGEPEKYLMELLKNYPFESFSA